MTLRSTLSIAAVGLVLCAPALAQRSDSDVTERRRAEARERAAAQQAASGQTEIRVYDMSDFEDSDIPLMVRFGNLRQVIDMQFSAVTDDSFAVRATPTEHERLEELLETVRGDRDEAIAAEAVTFVVQVYIAELSAEAARGMGVGEYLLIAPDLEGVKVIANPQLGLADDTSAQVQIARTETYIAGYQPVVSNNAVAYQPRTETIEAGLVIELSVESLADGRARLNIEGEMAEAEIVEQTLQLGEARLPIGLPHTDSRRLEARSTVRFSQRPIVVSVMQGFEGESDLLALAVAIREIEPEGDSAR